MGKFLSVTVKAAATRSNRPERGFCTDETDRKVHCVVCGCPVRSKLGTVCSKPRCHARAASRGER